MFSFISVRLKDDTRMDSLEQVEDIFSKDMWVLSSGILGVIVYFFIVGIFWFCLSLLDLLFGRLRSYVLDRV